MTKGSHQSGDQQHDLESNTSTESPSWTPCWPPKNPTKHQSWTASNDTGENANPTNLDFALRERYGEEIDSFKELIVKSEVENNRIAKRQKRPKTGGRQAGTPNRCTTELRNMIMGALNAGKGGQAYLEECKHSEDASVRVAFINLVKQLLPKDVKVTDPVSIRVITGIDPALGEPGAN